MSTLLKAGRPSAEKRSATLADVKSEKVRLNVDIDKSLHRKLKQRALDQDKRVADIVREMLEGSLA
jgi:hypothetical protein